MRWVAIWAVMALAGCSTAGETGLGAWTPGSPDAAHHLANFAPSEPTGVRLYSVTHPQNISLLFRGEFQFDVDNYAPLHFAGILPNGEVQPILSNLDFDNAQLAGGDGIIYAGAAGQSVHSPNLTTNDAPANQYSFTTEVESPRAVLALAWGHPKGPLAFDIYGAAGTTMKLVAEGPATTAELRDHGDGTRVGFPGAVVSLNDHLSIGREGDDTFGYVVVIAGGVAQGEIRLVGSEASHSIALAHRGTDSGNFSVTRYYFVMRGPVDVTSTLAADGRTRVFVVAAPIPVGTVPPTWWAVAENIGQG